MTTHKPIRRWQRLWSWTTLATLILLLSACGQTNSGAGQPAAPGTGATAAAFTPVVAASELVVGRNRVPIGVIKNNAPLNDPQLKVQLRFFPVGGDAVTPAAEAEAVYRGQGLPAGLYVAYVTLDKAGGWNMEARIEQADGAAQVSRVRIEVVETASTPPVGSQAVASKNLTIKEMPDLAQLTSDIKPDPDLYQITVADAIAAKKPFLVAFSTPGFCQTAVCGPNLQVIKKIKNDLKGQVNFLHVEVYQYPFGDSFQQQRQVPAMAEWKLQTEPWTFLVDANGVIQAKYEGGITFDEMEPALKQLAAGQPVQPQS
ncbi:MAG: thioredoxin family protein [Chloroflexales bacterium]|nr:thioredoxin family protein [Chloroflexales bacterium]